MHTICFHQSIVLNLKKLRTYVPGSLVPVLTSLFIVCPEISPSFEVPSLSACDSLINELGACHFDSLSLVLHTPTTTPTEGRVPRPCQGQKGAFWGSQVFLGSSFLHFSEGTECTADKVGLWEQLGVFS